MPPAKKPWFRFYVEALTDKKLRRQKVETRWLFVACLAASRESPLPGWLMVADGVPMTTDDLADYASLTRRQVDAGLAALLEVGVIELNTDIGAWHVTRWSERQYESDTSTERVAKHRSNTVTTTNDRPLHHRFTGVDGTSPEVRSQITDLQSSPSDSRAAQPPPTDDDEIRRARTQAETDLAEREAAQGPVANRDAWLQTATQRRLAEPRTDTGLDHALAAVRDGIQRIGRYGERPELPPPADAAITRLGGWQAVCDLPANRLEPALRQALTEAHAS